MREPLLILVDENDNAMGTAGKMQVHQQGWLHRAFSVVVYNGKGELLLQQRATEKYHSGGLWTNTCCSHAVPQQELLQTAQDRLVYEMGLTCSLQLSGHFKYKVNLENGLIENEFDYIFTGVTDEQPAPQLEEVMAFAYFPIEVIRDMLQEKPEHFTYWFRLLFDYLHPTQ